ncbi:hypothetical protein BD779DRAFT_1452610 [Infundibulicybe gibba]|nr:hypothetical protein BD779DRAFT_1452610 [Infundibulicybe gibba]
MYGQPLPGTSNTRPTLANASSYRPPVHHSRHGDAGDYLRRKLNLSPGTPVNLGAIPDPEPGQRPSLPLPILAQLAIYGSTRQRLTLQEIYTAIESRFPIYRENKAWRNSIRHNLSLNKVFRSTPRPITEPGKVATGSDISQGEGYKRERKRRSKKQASKAREATDVDGKSDEDDEVSMPSSPDSLKAWILRTLCLARVLALTG